MFVLEETIEQIQNLQRLYNFILSRLIEETTKPENLIDFVENNQAASLGKGLNCRIEPTFNLKGSIFVENSAFDISAR